MKQYNAQKSRSNKAISGIIAFLLAALAFVGMFMLANHFIHWVSHMFDSHDAQLVCTIVLWIVCFSTVLYAAVFIGGLIFGAVSAILRHLYN